MLSTRLTTIAFVAAAWCLTSGEMFYDVACPGVNSELKCPEGHVINVTSIESGVTSDADCSDRAKPGLVTASTCIQPELLHWVGKVCNHLSRCHLPKPHAQMFTCDYSDDTFVQISYECLPRNPAIHTAIACEGNTLEIHCENGIKIVKANYGRLCSTTCTDTPTLMTFCTSDTAEEVVIYECDEDPECEVTAKAETLGNPYPCDDNPKYLHVEYFCQ